MSKFTLQSKSDQLIQNTLSHIICRGDQLTELKTFYGWLSILLRKSDSGAIKLLR